MAEIINMETEGRMYFLSPEACDSLNKQIEKLPNGNGLVYTWDGKTGAVASIGLAHGNVVSFNIFGPNTREQAEETLKELKRQAQRIQKTQPPQQTTH